MHNCLTSTQTELLWVRLEMGGWMDEQVDNSTYLEIQLLLNLVVWLFCSLTLPRRGIKPLAFTSFSQN